jgi:hypothetical protein
VEDGTELTRLTVGQRRIRQHGMGSRILIRNCCTSAAPVCTLECVCRILHGAETQPRTVRTVRVPVDLSGMLINMINQGENLR